VLFRNYLLAIFSDWFIPVRYSMTAAMYTGDPTPIRKRCVPIFKYRCIRPTGNVTLARCDFDIAFWRFLPPLADIVSYVFVTKFTITTAPTQNNVNRINLRCHWMTYMKMIYINLLWIILVIFKPFSCNRVLIIYIGYKLSITSTILGSY
jgi:hypothetical protein